MALYSARSASLYLSCPQTAVFSGSMAYAASTRLSVNKRSHDVSSMSLYADDSDMDDDSVTENSDSDEDVSSYRHPKLSDESDPLVAHVSADQFELESELPLHELTLVSEPEMSEHDELELEHSKLELEHDELELEHDELELEHDELELEHDKLELEHDELELEHDELELEHDELELEHDEPKVLLSSASSKSLPI